MKHHHTVVWIDHHEAHILSFGMAMDASDWDRQVIHAEHAPSKLHHRSEGTSSGHAPEDSRYYLAVADALASAGEVLLTGPGNAKDHFSQIVQRAHPRLAARIVGVEPIDHPSEAELVAHARKAFKRIDRMKPQQPRA